MKSKILYLFLVVLISFQATAFAQKEVLNKAEINKFKKGVAFKASETKTIKSNFVQTKRISVLDNNVISSGKLVFKSPNLVKWEYLKPESNIAIFKNNELLVSSNGKSKTLNLNTNKWFKQLNELIVNSVTGDMFDEEKFDITYFNNGKDYLVVFKPKDKRLKKYMSQFELTFPNNGFEVQTVKLVEPNKDFTLIEFKDRVNNIKVLDTEFIL